MEKIDPQAQQRVWQRVRGEQPAAPQEQLLMVMEAEILAQLQALIRYFPGKAPELRSIQTQTQEHLACLQGMSLLRRGIKPHKSTGKAGNADPTALVRKCYVNCVNLAKNYEAASDDPEYGIAYAQMAAAKRRHCTQLLSLLGSKK